MLNDEIRRKIDNCRNILLAKLPIPTDQVKQITLALIYKFMDDMDKAEKDLGGKATFFGGKYKEYAWDKIMSKSLPGSERVKLYNKGLEEISKNPEINPLYQEIFKDAYLPFKDPEVVYLFLKEIDWFEYEKNGDIGDAFEYLLKTMGSQGNAGQFLTPRHIIDFIVECVDPTKEDKILDPACGTGGFLISAFNHIKRQNTDKKPWDKLKVKSDRNKIAGHITGFDIAHDMVRLASVNLFLHKFPDPHIYEYDTLVEDRRWDEQYSCILANPPFMTPKGGISPHNKFQIKANRAEVLFVDYILEHLTTTGRAGIIVPEGIIFQSANAYVDLRKMLLDNGLYAVVSLPSGVFNPYSGVKTSILLIDKTLKTKDVLFVKINNDGKDLGAQRRDIEDNDLPNALELIKKYKEFLKEGKKFKLSGNDFTLANLAEKKKIKENDSNLSGERYKENDILHNSKWEMEKLSDILDYEQPTNYIVGSVDYKDSYKTPVLTAGQTFILGYTDEEKGIFNKNLPVIIFDDFTTATKFVNFPFKVKSSAMKILKLRNNKRDDILFVYYMIQNIKFNSQTHKRYWISEFSNIKIPRPPLDVQKKIVEELDGYQKIIDGAQQVVDNWKPSIEIDPLWKHLKLDDICEVQSGGTPSRSVDKFWKNGTTSWYSSGELNDIFTSPSKEKITMKGLENSNAKIFPKGSLLIGMYDTAAFKMSILSGEAAFNQAIAGIKPNKRLNMLFLLLFFSYRKPDYLRMRVGARQRNLTKEFICNLKIPIPSIEIQNSIVTKVLKEKNIIESNIILIKEYDEKIKSKIAEIWGK